MVIAALTEEERQFRKIKRLVSKGAEAKAIQQALKPEKKRSQPATISIPPPPKKEPALGGDGSGDGSSKGKSSKLRRLRIAAKALSGVERRLIGRPVFLPPLERSQPVLTPQIPPPIRIIRESPKKEEKSNPLYFLPLLGAAALALYPLYWIWNQSRKPLPPGPVTNPDKIKNFIDDVIGILKGCRDGWYAKGYNELNSPYVANLTAEIILLQGEKIPLSIPFINSVVGFDFNLFGATDAVIAEASKNFKQNYVCQVPPTPPPGTTPGPLPGTIIPTTGPVPTPPITVGPISFPNPLPPIVSPIVYPTPTPTTTGGNFSPGYDYIGGPYDTQAQAIAASGGTYGTTQVAQKDGKWYIIAKHYTDSAGGGRH